MLSFMDYVLREFGNATDFNWDNSYSALTATSDALLAFPTPSTLSLNVSSLSTANFATAYTLSTLGQIDGSISYLYTTVPLGNLPSQSQAIPLKNLVHGYRDIQLPIKWDDDGTEQLFIRTGRKPTILHATLALPPPSNFTGLYARRINPWTLLSISMNSKSITIPSTSGPPSATVLAHLQRDTGRYSIEGLASTDHALLGVRGLWNFGVSPSRRESDELNGSVGLNELGGIPSIPISPTDMDKLSLYHRRLSAKPSLLSAGAEFYYSPFSHVIGLSTGLRFTTLASHITPPTAEAVAESAHLFASKPLAGTSAALSSVLAPSHIPHSSFPYTMTLTMTPLTGALSSSYSVRPTPSLALSSRFDFNVYSWESQYVFGAEVWRTRRQRSTKQIMNPEGHLIDADPTAWARRKTENWFSPEERALKEDRIEREEENVVNVRVDDSWNIKALWTGRVKALLVSAGFSISPVSPGMGGLRSRSASSTIDDDGRRKRWTGTVGLSIAYST